MTIEAVVFDVGETLIDETRQWSEWADWMGVPRFTFLAALGGVIAKRQHHREVFRLLKPGFDYDAARAARFAQGWRYIFEPSDFYPDAIDCLRKLKARGLKVGVAGNQYRECETEFAKLALPLDLAGSSEGWGMEKPSPRFFARIVSEIGVPAQHIAYVGDHPFNDIAPAVEAGMTAIFIRRGPWAVLHGDTPEAKKADLCIETLRDLPDLLARR